jgi:hypothetical protein
VRNVPGVARNADVLFLAGRHLPYICTNENRSLSMMFTEISTTFPGPTTTSDEVHARFGYGAYMDLEFERIVRLLSSLPTPSDAQHYNIALVRNVV